MKISLGDEIKRRSTSGYSFLYLGNSQILWKSITTLKNIALSATEGEYSSLIECTKISYMDKKKILQNELFNKK